jgi:Ribbon-helix-helix protein, copG family.
MRKVISISLEEEILDVLKKRALKRHLSLSRTIELALRKELRIR